MSVYFYIGILVIVLLVLFFIPAGLWMMARVSGVKLSFIELTIMKLRRSPVRELVYGMVMLHMADLQVDIKTLEAHSLAGGNVTNVVYGMVVAKKAGLDLSFKKASEADLRGVKLPEAVQQYIDKQGNGNSAELFDQVAT
ncbi:MAG: flotillin-like FloA family protein [Bacteroidales bacterium]